ncbi:MAG TPA: CRISPR-associated endonuclease Cas2 [Candidatus Paceibacterota bacterium]|nr:CRISPR-associated endonuclease Cas2 [Candidatus Paceibacterota bacterium]HPR84016.1 CRISPR-associated endonuclease Cas2 [Candidatus Paceibacterota bacterium]
MNIEREILNYLEKDKGKHQIRHRGIRVNLLGLPDFKYYKYQSLASKFSVLKKRNYLKEINGHYFITNKGSDYLHRPSKKSFRKFTPTNKKTSRDLLVIYDVPQGETTLRNWFRKQLKEFGFIMIQRSVWLGPSPLPSDFTSYIKEIGLKDKVKLFKLKASLPSNN